MVSDRRLRQYLVVKADAEFIKVYREMNLDSIRAHALNLLRLHGAPEELATGTDIEIHSAPSTRFSSSRSGEAQGAPAELVIAFVFRSREIAETFRRFVRDHVRMYIGGNLDGSSPIGGQQAIPLGSASGSSALPGALSFNAGADPAGFLTSAPSGMRQARVFGTRAMARAMLGADALAAHDLSGRGVNVVIVDRGLNRAAIEALGRGNWGEGLDVDVAHRDGSGREVVKAGSAPVTSHGMMIARNVLDLAPAARLYDVPLLPPLIDEPSFFASTANATFHAILDMIDTQRRRTGETEPWILVNAWAIFDRSSEWPPGDYTQNRHLGIEKWKLEELTITMGHPLNLVIEEAAKQNIDIVFGAGNCGQFSTSSRCGESDRGPGCSIWGANGHPSVLTVAAVSVDGTWMGYSSEGPSRWSLQGPGLPEEATVRKPDIAAPSHFRDDNNPAFVNSGTSAAAALAAGVMAAVRSKWGPSALSSMRLKEDMIESARGGGGAWSPRIGRGILHVPGLIKKVAQSRPS